MATISFEDIKFHAKDGGVRALFLGRYYFDLSNEELNRIGTWHVENRALEFPQTEENHAWKRFEQLMDQGFTRLRHLLYDKPTVYIHSGLGVPLIGTNEFGLVDRGSNIIEVKPLTGCNFQCPYCSVDEGKNDKTHDYLVECDFLVQEAAKLAARKEHPVEFNIGPQGEPLLYPKFLELVRGLRAIPNCAIISVNTNGSLLTERFIDDLAKAGLTRINLSLNAVTQEGADRMAGKRYPLEKTLKLVEYAQGKIAILLAPTIVPGFNDAEVEGLVKLGTTLKSEFPAVGMQNYLIYQKGRNPAKERSFDEFFAMLKPLEEKYGINLTDFTKEDFRIHDEPELEKPFKKNDVIRAHVALPGRYPKEVVAVAQERCITIVDDRAPQLMGKDVRVRIIRDKHNIFKATLA
jgi:uncharacterized Fe-S cluster-containing radical SAM superfamily enzyme